MKRFALFIGIVMVAFFLASCSSRYVCPRGGGTAKSLQECPNYGLYVQDHSLLLSDLPEGHIIDDEKTGIQLGDEISVGDLERGWQEGYFCAFVKPDEAEQLVEEGVYCFIARYDSASLAGIFSDPVDTNASENITHFSAPTIGDDSVAYWYYNQEMGVSSYTIEFVKRDIYAGVTVEKVGQADLSADAIRYAQLIASRIP